MKAIIIPENIKIIGVDSFTWKDNSSEEKAIVKIYSADCDFYSNSIDLNKVDKIYGYAGSTAERIANINYKNFYAFGDTNCDNGVDMSDAVLIMQSLANPNKYVSASVIETGTASFSTLSAIRDAPYSVNIAQPHSTTLLTIFL